MVPPPPVSPTTKLVRKYGAKGVLAQNGAQHFIFNIGLPAIYGTGDNPNLRLSPDVEDQV